MKSIIKVFAIALLSTISYAVVTTLDIVMYTVALLNKGVRLGYVAMDKLINGNETDSDELNATLNFIVNFSYKAMVDKLYPTYEDEP